MDTIHVKIEGLYPLLVNRFHEEAQAEASSGVHSRKELDTPFKDAENRLYRNETLGVYFPAENIRQSIIVASSRHKIGRKAATADVAAALYVDPEVIPLTEPWVVDSRAVVIPATRGRILRHRPSFPKWTLSFNLRVDTALIDLNLVRRIVDDAGNYVGIGDYRPARKGPYGRFSVVLWEHEAR
jgi:hypothetical protein